MDEIPVWVRLPRLPPFSWVDSVFRGIGNNMGWFLEADMSFVHTGEKGLARILVSLNPREGLAKEINLKYKDISYTQMIDYEQWSFHYHRPHKYRHLARECPLGFRRRRTQRKEGGTKKTRFAIISFFLIKLFFFCFFPFFLCCPPSPNPSDLSFALMATVWSGAEYPSDQVFLALFRPPSLA